MSNFSIMIWIICSILTGLTVAWLALAVLYVKERIIVPSTKQGNNVVFSRVADQPPYLVSVIVPARNEEAYIKRCLLSLLSQRYASFEVIVIDDSSTDKTAKIVEAIRDKRLRLIQLKKTPDGWREKVGRLM
jgi:chlorobactene glucosyltransferase